MGGAAGRGRLVLPPASGTPLLPVVINQVLTPHIASSTEETARAMGDCVVDNLVSWFEGRGALNPVT